MRGRTTVAVGLLLAVAGSAVWYGTGPAGLQTEGPGTGSASSRMRATVAGVLDGLGIDWVTSSPAPATPTGGTSDGLGTDWVTNNPAPTTTGGGSDGLGIDWVTNGPGQTTTATGGGSSDGLGIDWVTKNPEPTTTTGGSSGGLGMDWVTKDPSMTTEPGGMGIKWLVAITYEQRQALTRQIEGAYVQFLARTATKQEIEAEFKLLEADADLRTSESITGRVVALLKRDAASQEAVVRKAYSETRRREPTAAEMQAWRQRISASAPPYADIAAEVGKGADPLYGAGVCQNAMLTEALTRVMGRAPEGSGATGECDERGWGPFKTVDEAERNIAKATRVWAVCTDPVLRELLWKVTGAEPQGYKANLACDPGRYGKWESPAELEKLIAIAYKQWGICRYPKLTKAVTEVMRRPPEGYSGSGECDIYRYGWPWKDYADLRIKVGVAFQQNLLTETMIHNAYITAYGRLATADEVKQWRNTPGTSPYVRSVESLLNSLRVSISAPTVRQELLQRAATQLYKRSWDQGFAARYQSVPTTGVFYQDLKPLLAGVFVDDAYRHLLGRAADPAGRQHYVNLMVNQGWEPERIWGAIAGSQERLDGFGYFAPHQTDYGGKRELCFGAIGSKCSGAPKSNPEWVDKFHRGDGVEMGYIRIQVSVGSILHDNACTRNGTGIMCNGLIKGLTQDQMPLATYMQPAALEWNKAVYNTIDNRFWTATFGPYPTNTRLQDTYSDDLTQVSNRASKMAPVASLPFAGAGLGAIPLPVINYTGGETRQTAVLKAPSGTALDAGDDAFCASGSAKGTGDLWALLLTKYWINCN